MPMFGRILNRQIVLLFLLLCLYPSLAFTADKEENLVPFNQQEWEDLKEKISLYEISNPNIAQSMKQDLVETLADPEWLASVKIIDPDIEDQLKQWQQDLENIAQNEEDMRRREEDDEREKVLLEQYDRESERDSERRENQLDKNR